MKETRVPSSLGMVHSTLISLKGIMRLLSIFESKPRIRDAWRKFLFVAAKAFMAAEMEKRTQLIESK
ncbi:hypothetical protein F2Q70_00006501 [Brassica cretica]|uniref:Uncharacterized protein n=1 Tax=Brassica cretica TaxID=69181 RepID=A0A8S9IVT2_BRACR|nr:hypothetical protein F2Q70_00006501 [Brassica cretica]